MSLYDAIRKEARRNDTELSIRDTAKVAGTLRLADITETSPLFSRLVKQELARLLALGAGAEDSFRQIDASLAKGSCPRCNKSTQEVKLYDYTPTNYCTECHIALWPATEEQQQQSGD